MKEYLRHIGKLLQRKLDQRKAVKAAEAHITFLCDGDLKAKLKGASFHDLESNSAWWAQTIE